MKRISDPCFITLTNTARSLELEAADLRDLCERLKMEAQIHAQEARTANSTIAEIYQIVTGKTGEPGNWNGAEPVRSCIKDLRERLAKAEKNAEKRPDTVHEFLADENGVVDLLPSGDVVPPNLKLTFSGETGELIKAEVIE